MGTDKYRISSILLLLLLAFTTTVLAQRGNNHISIGVEAGPAINWQRSGFPLQLGVPFKAYLGTGKKGQLMLRSGLHHFPIPLTFHYDF